MPTFKWMLDGPLERDTRPARGDVVGSFGLVDSFVASEEVSSGFFLADGGLAGFGMEGAGCCGLGVAMRVVSFCGVLGVASSKRDVAPSCIVVDDLVGNGCA